MATLNWRIYFPPTGELDGLLNERARVQGCADRAASQYAEALRKIDERIAELRAATQEAMKTT